MRRKGLNPAWIQEIKEKLVNAKEINGSITFEPVITSYNPAAKWLIKTLAERGFVPHVEQLGAGVKRISIKGTCCKLCGRISGK